MTLTVNIFNAKLIFVEQRTSKKVRKMTDQEIWSMCFDYLAGETQLRLKKSERERLLRQINAAALRPEKELPLQQRLAAVEANITGQLLRLKLLEETLAGSPAALARLQRALRGQKDDKI